SFRRQRRDLAKKRREMALILETGAQPDFDNRQLAFDQQLFGEINSAMHQELNWSRAGGLFEGPREMERTRLRDLGDFQLRQVAVEIFVNEFGHAAKFTLRQPAKIMLESFAGRRVMSEQMGHQRVDQRLGVN